MGKSASRSVASTGTATSSPGAAAWRTIKNFGDSQSYVLFKNVKAPSDVKYLGAVRVTGNTLHKVAIPGALLIHPNTIPGMSQKEQVDDTELDVRDRRCGPPTIRTWKLWAGRGSARARVSSSASSTTST
jgi:hypothetical protein